MKYLVLMFLLVFSVSCSSGGYKKTVNEVEINKFMGKWYVIAARGTYIESDAYNSLEEYSWNEKDQRIDINFTYHDGSFDAEKESLPQKAWIINKDTNAHWEVSPFWPMKFDYLVIDMDKDYQWVVVGVPNQKYLWIMSRDWKMEDRLLSRIVSRIRGLKYSVRELRKVPQKW